MQTLSLRVKCRLTSGQEFTDFTNQIATLSPYLRVKLLLAFQRNRFRIELNV
jgi:hypothetical protein